MAPIARTFRRLGAARFPVLLTATLAAARRLAFALGSATIVTVLLLAAAPPASAKVVEVTTGSGKTTVGLQPRNTTTALDGGLGSDFGNPSGNPVLHRTEVYAIYWDPRDKYHGDWQHLIDTFLQGMGAESGKFNNVFIVDSQYSDKSNLPASTRATFRGAYTDTTEYPTAGCTDPAPMEVGDAITCLTDSQIRGQLQSFISAHGLQAGMGSIFYLLTPPGVTVCIDEGASASHCSSNTASANSFCSYHSDINPDSATNGDSSTILYADIPWVAGGLGDYHLGPGDQKASAYACQDGAFDPSTEPPEKKEAAKEKNAAEITAFEAMDAEEKAKANEAEALEGPRPQEPNQAGLGPDGSYDTGLADILTNQIAVEQQNTVTDPLLDAWQGQDVTRDEATDECRNFFDLGGLSGSSGANAKTFAGSLSNQTLGGRGYYLNAAFNLAAFKLPYPAIPCVGGIQLAPEFTAPNPVNVNEIVAFDGMESDITLNVADHFEAGPTVTETYAKYSWNFGDETPVVTGYAPGAPACIGLPWLPPCAASVFHSYQYGGEYPVTLTVTDVGGNTFSETHTVTVIGPAKPAPTVTPPPTPPVTSVVSGTSGSSSPGSSGSGSGATKSVPAPVATAAVATTSLKTALSSGLTIRYSVNEQVTGSFEVLLASSVARKIGLHGTPATGLPPGSAPQIIIAKAILVTTKGGRDTVKILFGKKTAALLHKLKKVSLMVRLVVRNGSSKSPATTTVVSIVTLH